MLWRSSASLAFLLFAGATKAVTVTVSSTASHPIPTTLWGMMFEDINHSGDGGLYGELLVNRAFQQVTPGTPAALSGWSAINDASLNVVKTPTPVSSALPNALEVKFPDGKTGAVGFSNAGFYGIKVTADSTYTASFYYRFPSPSTWSGPATVALQSTSGTILGSTTATLSGSQTSWKQITVTLKPSASGSDTSNVFSITIDGSAGAQTIQFAMLSLFPPTFKNRPNGMRQDLAQVLYDAGPKLFRFPGGNNLEGQTIATRWQWNATVGPLIDRPGRAGDWGYGNTDGLGLLEYLYWCEDAELEPIMAVWAGYALGGETVASADLQPYIQQAIDQINFVVGDPSKSDAAALRSSLGHPEPFKLNYVEIGNEDFLAASSYPDRWNAFATALKAEFPDISFLATTNVNEPVLSPKPSHYDVHVYQSPDWFVSNAFYYDSFARDGTKYFEGEYAAISTNDSDIWNHRVPYPTLQTAAGEAAFMTGLERNSDIVFAAAYAPLLNHVSGTQWSPNLVSFDSANVYLSTSYYVQKLFAQNSGDEYIPSTLPASDSTVHWSVVRKTSTNELIIKVVNAGSQIQSIGFSLPFDNIGPTGTIEILTGLKNTDSNTPSQPNYVAPRIYKYVTAQNFTYSYSGYSVAVITISLNGGTVPYPTTTAPPTPTATGTPTPSQTQSHYGQCGGLGYTGPTVCTTGTYCWYSNFWFSQCL